VTATAVFKYRDLILSLTAWVVTATQLVKVGDNVLFAQSAIFDWNGQFADLTDGGFSGIDKNLSAAYRGVVGLSHIEGKGAHQIEMAPGRQPFPVDKGLLGHGRATDEISV
jgi:hypothetical protein